MYNLDLVQKFQITSNEWVAISYTLGWLELIKALILKLKLAKPTCSFCELQWREEITSKEYKPAPAGGTSVAFPAASSALKSYLSQT
jgi:hypothetical protein